MYPKKPIEPDKPDKTKPLKPIEINKLFESNKLKEPHKTDEPLKPKEHNKLKEPKKPKKPKERLESKAFLEQLEHNEENCALNFERFNDMHNQFEFDKLLDFSKIKFANININLIHYDKNLKNKENMEYYRYFCVNIKGSYYPTDDFVILKLLLSKINNNSYIPNYILMISGSEAETKLKELINYNFIQEIVIFCRKDTKYTYLKDIYGKIKLITKKFDDVLNFLRSKIFLKKILVWIIICL